jgi:hypothetical protein
MYGSGTGTRDSVISRMLAGDRMHAPFGATPPFRKTSAIVSTSMAVELTFPPGP